MLARPARHLPILFVAVALACGDDARPTDPTHDEPRFREGACEETGLLGGPAEAVYAVGGEWCTDCPFVSQATVTAADQDRGFEARLRVSPQGHATLIVLGNADASHAAWIDVDASDAAPTQLPDVAYAPALAVDADGRPAVLFPTQGPAPRFMLSAPPNEHEIAACLDSSFGTRALGLELRGDGVHGIGTLASFPLETVATLFKPPDGEWVAHKLGVLGESTPAMATLAPDGRWLVAASTNDGFVLLREGDEPVPLDQLDVPGSEQDFYPPRMPPHPRLKVLPLGGEDVAVMALGSRGIGVQLSDGRVIRIPTEEFLEDVGCDGSNECGGACSSRGNITTSATIFDHEEMLYVAFPRLVVDATVHWSPVYCDEDQTQVCECVEAMVDGVRQAELVVARFDPQTLDGDIVLTTPLPTVTGEQIWLTAEPFGGELVVAFKDYGVSPVFVGRLDLALLQ